jgi:hypothetical protein
MLFNICGREFSRPREDTKASETFIIFSIHCFVHQQHLKYEAACENRERRSLILLSLHFNAFAIQESIYTILFISYRAKSWVFNNAIALRAPSGISV